MQPETPLRHLLHTYGRSPAIWMAAGMELFRALVMRVYVVALMAAALGAVAGGDFERARHYVLLYLVSNIVAGIVGSAGELIGVRAENEVYGVQTAVYYERLTNKDMSFYRDSHTGYLTSMFRQYLDSSILLARFFRGNFVRTFVSLTVPVIVLLFASWKVGLVAVFVVVSQLIYMQWASKKAVKYRQASSEIYRKIAGVVTDDITNIIAYKSAGREQAALQNIVELRKQETRAFQLRRRSAVVLDFPRNLITVALISLSFWLSLDASHTTAQSVSLLVLTMTYMFQIYRNVSDVPDMIYQYDDYISKLEPTLEVFGTQNETITDRPSAKNSVKRSADIDIQNLVFTYGEAGKKTKIFNNFNLHVAAGERVGIVGLSGAGKSTLASLLMRFDDIDSGAIRIGGDDIRDIAQSTLRRAIAYVPQEPVLFHRTIAQNIAYHNHTATQKDIEHAAKAAHAHDFITSLPDGYDTIVGERGVKLSGGQKQRIVIARAVLKDASIVLFDEATSALDSESEQIIQQALPDIIGGQTAIIIAHRLSTVAGLDRIIVMHGGTIEEQGTHAQLLKNKGRYYSLWQKQTRST